MHKVSFSADNFILYLFKNVLLEDMAIQGLKNSMRETIVLTFLIGGRTERRTFSYDDRTTIFKEYCVVRPLAAKSVSFICADDF